MNAPELSVGSLFSDLSTTLHTTRPLTDLSNSLTLSDTALGLTAAPCNDVTLTSECTSDLFSSLSHSQTELSLRLDKLRREGKREQIGWELERKELLHRLQILGLELSQQRLKAETEEARRLTEKEEWEESLHAARAQTRMLQVRLQSSSTSTTNNASAESREHSVMLEKLRDKILELEGRGTEIREALASTQLHTSRLLTPQEYTKLKQFPPTLLPIQDQLRLFVFEATKTLQTELETARHSSGDSKKDLENSKYDSAKLQVEIAQLNKSNEKLGEELREERAALARVRDQIRTGEYKLDNYDELMQERNRLREELLGYRQGRAELEVDLKARNDETRVLSEELISLRQSNSLLTQDKSYLSRRSSELGVRCEGLEERARGSERELSELREAREQLYDKFIQVRESFKTEFEKKLEEEVSSLRARTESELDRLRSSTREMHEREVSSERESRDSAVLEREQSRRDLSELQSKHESVLSEFRQLQLSTDSRVGQLDQELRMTRFELEKSQMLQEEYLLSLKQGQVELDKFRKKLDVSTQQCYAKDSEYSQHRAQLEARNAELLERVRSYESLEKDMDQAVYDAAQLEDEGESKRILNILGLYDSSVCGKGTRALRQSAHLARQVLKLERDKSELQRGLQESEKRLEAATDRLVAAQESAEISRHPSSYLTELLRSRETELREARARVKDLAKRVGVLETENEKVKNSRSALALDLQRLVSKREEILHVKESVSAIRESARIAMEQLGPDPKPVVFVKAP